MTAPRRKRTPRKTPPGTKPLPRKISDADMQTRRDLDARVLALQEAEQEIARGYEQVAGARAFWRETVINPKYHMTEADYIDDDGTIVRGGADA